MYQRMKTIRDCLQERILVIDGAMGTMIQRHKPPKRLPWRAIQNWHIDMKNNSDVLNITQPQLIKKASTGNTSKPAPTSSKTTFMPPPPFIAGRFPSCRTMPMRCECGRRGSPEGGRRIHHKGRNSPASWPAIGPLNKTLSLSPDKTTRVSGPLVSTRWWTRITSR